MGGAGPTIVESAVFVRGHMWSSTCGICVFFWRPLCCLNFLLRVTKISLVTRCSKLYHMLPPSLFRAPCVQRAILPSVFVFYASRSAAPSVPTLICISGYPRLLHVVLSRRLFLAIGCAYIIPLYNLRSGIWEASLPQCIRVPPLVSTSRFVRYRKSDRLLKAILRSHFYVPFRSPVNLL